MSQEAHEISAALGAILNQGFRTSLYAELTAGIHEGFDAGTYTTLSALERCLGIEESVNAATVARHLGLDRSVVSRRCSSLAAQGLLRVERSPDDGRQALLSLTPAGHEAMDMARSRLRRAIDARTSGWTADEKTTFARLLKRFTDDGPLRLSRAEPPSAS